MSTPSASASAGGVHMRLPPRARNFPALLLQVLPNTGSLTLKSNPAIFITSISSAGDFGRLSPSQNSIAMDTQYKYTPLAPRQIRTLSLLPSEHHDAPLRACLLIRNMPAPADGSETITKEFPLLGYEALSYAWGSPDEKNPNSVAIVASFQNLAGENVPLGTLSIRANLASALRYLRDPAASRTLWADSLCINQLDLDERASQVILMGEIYTRAQRVIIWLGEPADDSAIAIKTLNTLGSAVDYDPGKNEYSPKDGVDLPNEWREYLSHDMAPHPFSGLEMRAVAGLLRRAWFRRLWVWQEALLGQEWAMVRCGEEGIPWGVFVNAVIALSNDKVAHPPRLAEKEMQTYFANVAHLLISLSSSFIDSSPLEIVVRMRFCECADERDRVYGILNLQAWDSFRGRVRPDYTLGEMEVYRQFVLSCWYSGRTLWFLQVCELDDRSKGPGSVTWVPDLSKLRNQPYPFHTPFASGSTEGFLHELGGESGHRLRVGAVYCATVTDAGLCPVIPVSGPGAGHNVETLIQVITDLALGQVGRPGGRSWYGDESRGLVAALLAVRTSRGELPGVRVLEYWVARAMGLIPTDESSPRSTDRTSDEMAVLDALGYGFVGRACHQTDDGAYVIGTRAARVGDRLFVIVGCSSPILLRPVEGKDCLYQIVGHCFHPGYMLSEALLGPIPEGWEASFPTWIGPPVFNRTHRSPDDEHDNRLRQTMNDPRLTMPDGWVTELSGKSNEFLTWKHINNEGRVTQETSQHPAASIKNLRAMGVSIEDIILV